MFQEVLNMHNIKKILPRILLILVTLVCYAAVVRFFYQPADDISPYIKRELEESAGKIDTLFCGTSTAYHGFSPQIWDEQMGGYSFNIASPSQCLKDTYFYIKQETKRNPVERIFLGISPKGMMKEEISLQAKLRVYDCLDGFLSKASYLLNNCDMDQWPYLAFYPNRVESYFRLGEVKENVSYKTSQAYQDNEYPGKAYQGKGYFAPTKVYKGQQYQSLEKAEGKWNTEEVNQEEETYLRKIMQYCKENQIEFILVYIPVTGNQILKDGDADSIHGYFSRIAQEEGVEFWDFLYYRNLIQEYSNDKFKDAHHLNKTGGTQFSQTIVEIYQTYQKGETLDRFFADCCAYYG